MYRLGVIKLKLLAYQNPILSKKNVEIWLKTGLIFSIERLTMDILTSKLLLIFIVAQQVV